MPQIQKVFLLDVTPQKFIDACDESELHEVILLANGALERTHREKAIRKELNEAQQRLSGLIDDALKCTCPTAAAMKYCKTDCDEK